MANRYFRGQGSVKIATRTALGAAGTLRPVGNCPSLSISATEDFSEHFESETGDRRMDLRIRTSLKVEVTFTLESLIIENLLMAFHGASGSGGVGEEVIEAFNADPVDYWLQFDGMNTLDSKSAFTVKMFKVRLSPPSAMQLISDELTGLEITGSVLYDSLNSGQGGYFTISQAAA